LGAAHAPIDAEHVVKYAPQRRYRPAGATPVVIELIKPLLQQPFDKPDDLGGTTV